MLRPLIAAIAGALIVFVWGAISWMALDYHWNVVGPLPSDAAVTQALKAADLKTGVYFVPCPPHTSPTDEQMRAFEEQHRVGPVYQIHYRAEGSEPMPPMMFVKGLTINFVAAYIAALIAQLAANAGAGFLRRGFTVALLGVFGALVGPVYLGNWDRWPENYTTVLAIDTVVGWVFAGIAIALITRAKKD